MTTRNFTPDPKLDLVFERVVPLTPAQIYRAWTTPSLILHWFTPAPWRTVECQLDLHPGGNFRTVMQSPEGENFPMTGCFLECVQDEKLVWTNALAPDYRPGNIGQHAPCITAVILLEPRGNGTLYRAMALHKDEADRAAHASMGFQEGWGKALDQLVELMQGQ